MNYKIDFEHVVKYFKKHSYAIAFLAIGAVYFSNLFLDIMDIDAAQYASISREMLENKSYLQVYNRGADYLDKPPMLFWLSSLSFCLFGISNFAYKLPSVLILILGIYSIYRFTLIHSDRETAKLAALILASTQALLLMTNDVRTDCMLVGFVSFSVWQIAEFIKSNSNRSLIFASLGVASAMMTKGPIGFIIPLMSVVFYAISARKISVLVRPKWLIMILLVGVMLVPMCVGLYYQYDLHPEKTVYGLTGPSGLRFFFWTQSFGRITGESTWQDDTGFFFFFHSILWDLQPWVLVFILALISHIISLFKPRNADVPERITLFVFLFMFLALSGSQYKLPHYIFPLIPFAAIITSQFLISAAKKRLAVLRWVFGFQILIASIFHAMIVLCYLYIFPTSNWLLYLFWAISVALHIYVAGFLKETILRRTVFITVLSFISFGLTTSNYFYPHLLRYQSGSQAGKLIAEKGVPNGKLYCFIEQNHSLDFYSRQTARILNLDSISTLPRNSVIYTNMDGASKIVKRSAGFEVMIIYDHFKVTQLTDRFLYNGTREKTLRKFVILQKVY